MLLLLFVQDYWGPLQPARQWQQEPSTLAHKASRPPCFDKALIGVDNVHNSGRSKLLIHKCTVCTVGVCARRLGRSCS
jgi:hypothetical protein